MKNSLRVFDETSVSKLWDYVDGVKNDLTAKEKEATATPAAAVVADVTAVPEEPKEETAAKTEPARKSSKKGVRCLTMTAMVVAQNAGRQERLCRGGAEADNICLAV